jgi:hypothetical protein
MFFSLERRPFWSRREWLLLTAGLTANAGQREDLRRILPPSEEPDPALVRLIARLHKILAAREHLALEAMMNPVFRVEFDAGKGSAAFRRHWRPESAGSPVWDILQRLITLPAHRYSDTLYAVPYVFARFPFDLDPLRYVVAVKKEVALLAEPKPDAKRVGTLDHSIVPLANPVQPPVIIPSGGFVELMHPDSGRCFAASDDIYHPSAHRAFFQKRAGQWRWISLAAATTEEPPVLRRHKSSGG